MCLVYPQWHELAPKRFGYWKTDHEPDLPNASELVDPDWDPAERDLCLQVLRTGTTHTSWKGYSRCRFCGELNGTRCHTLDGTWVWPEGLAHYVEEHQVRLPLEFIEFLRSVPAPLLGAHRTHRANESRLREGHQQQLALAKEGHCSVRAAGGCTSTELSFCRFAYPQGGSVSSANCNHEREAFFHLSEEEIRQHLRTLQDLGVGVSLREL